MVSHALTTTQGNDKSVWIMDSGVTSHMCNDPLMFSEVHTLEGARDVTLGDGRTLEASGRGIVRLTMDPATGRSVCALTNVMLVPGLAYNLFSVPRASEAGGTTEFGPTMCSVRVKGQVVARGRKQAGLYILHQLGSPERANLASVDTWHRRFGHLGMQNLAWLKVQSMVDGMAVGDEPTKTPPCLPCLEGRQHKHPFPEGGKRPSRLLELVHSDVCGKIGTHSLGGSDYFVTFVDGRSHHVWVYSLRSKDQVFETFLQWQRMVEKESGQRVQILRTDNGGEYTSHRFRDHLHHSGICHETTVPKTPEQNGTAERFNRTLMETVRAMLSDSRLPKTFWAEALATAAYLRNRSPTKALASMTPYETWTGERPQVQHLKVFGCDAYAHVPKDERDKLDSKTKSCWFLGYGDTKKVYKLYDRSKRTIIYSRDVTFAAHPAKSTLEMRSELLTQGPIEPAAAPEEEIIEKTPTPDAEGDLPAPSDEEDEGVPIPRRGTRILPTAPERRRSERIREQGRLTERANCALEDPNSLSEALASPKSREWKKAMQREMDSLASNDTH